MKISYSDRDYTFGQAVLKLRSDIGLTQERLGKLLGISGRAISEWETGSSYPKAERLKALIELAVQYQAFPPEHEAEEIHVLWKAAHQKVLLDGHWLCLLLSWRSSPSPRVEPEALEETRSSISPPLLDVGMGANPIGANVGVGIGTREGHRKGADEADGGCRDGACPRPRPYGPLPSEAPAQTMAEQFLHRRGEDRDKTRLETDKMRERHKWLLANLIALIILTLMGSAGALFFQARGGAPSTTQANEVAGEQAGRTTTAQAYPSYLSWNGTLVFFDHLDQDVGSKWDSLGASSTESCQFTGGTYHVRKEAIGSVVLCSAHGTFSNFAFEVQLTVTQGDCGGVIFRSDGNGHFYYFRICQNGMYDVSKYDNISAVTNLRRSSSSAIHAGLGQQNKIAIMASGSTMAFYINEQQIDQEQDSSYTSGSIALIAAQYSDGGNVTDVAYSNARLWTL